MRYFKRIAVVLLFVFVNSLCAFSQTMTDDKIIEYIKKESAKGTSQQQIVTSLIKNGVTTAQLQRVRRKAENMAKKQASNTSLVEAPQLPAGQTRTPNSYDQYGQKQKADEKDMPATGLTMNQRGLYVDGDQDSLMWYMEHQEVGRRVYGRDIFNQQNLTFQPSTNMATPANYLLGPGDQVTINMWGAASNTISETITPEGYIMVDHAGVIRLAGLTVAQAKQTIKSKLGQYYSGCQFDLSIGDIRTIQVQVAGEVNMPGTYSMSSLSSAFNALYAAGGINQIGTLRDIKVYRNGRQIATVDVYAYLMGGDAAGSVHLQDNDVIVVGPYDCLVEVQGKVKRPMWYEMKSGESVKQLIQYCGGFTGDAYTDKVRLTRKAGANYSVHTLDEFSMTSFKVRDEDMLEVDSVRPRYQNTVEVRGAVKHAGKFELGSNIMTVRELLIAADGLTENAYQDRAVMHREKDDLTLEMVSVDIKGILAGTEPDIPLKSNDLLFIPSSTEMQGKRTISIQGEVLYPGIYPYAENTTVRDLILQAGGFTDAASLARVNVFRRMRDSRAAMDTKNSAQSFCFSLNEDYSLVEDTVFALMPFDEVFVRKSPAYEEQKNVTIKGCVNFEGDYTMTSKNYRLSDLIKAAGGFTQVANIAGASLERRMTDNEKEQRTNSFNKAQIDLYEQVLKEGKEMNRELADTLLQMKMSMGDTYFVALDLEQAVKDPGGRQDILLREGDVIVVPFENNTIKISGEVNHPISINYEEGKRLTYYIDHAGGYGNKAKKSSIYAVYSNGGVKRIRKHSSKDIQPGCEIVVPTKFSAKSMSTSEIIALSSGVASLASVVVALLTMLKK